MTNHVHLLLTPRDKESVGQLMKRVGQRYVQYINRTYRRSGTLWEGRFRSCIAQEDNYLLQCQRYIELNPVRAEMVEHPAEYRWSSYRSNAQGESDELLTPHFMYEKLGLTAAARETSYCEIFRYNLEPGLVDEIRKATNGNYVLGNDRFKEEMRRTLGQRLEAGKAGRPVKKKNKHGLCPIYEACFRSCFTAYGCGFYTDVFLIESNATAVAEALK